MGAFQSEKMFACNPAMIGTIANNIMTSFQSDGYECAMTPQAFGTQISIRKGGMFKAALGLKTALNVSLTPMGNNAINVKAGVGLFGTQAVPTAIALAFFWPVLITQIWGLVQQSKLDDRVIQIVESTITCNGQSFGGNSGFNSNFSNSGFNSGFNGGDFNGGNGGGFNGGGYGGNGGGFNGGGFNGGNGGGFNGGGFNGSNGGGYNNGNPNSAPNNNRFGGFRQQ